MTDLRQNSMTGEQWVFEERIADPASTEEGERWLRTDLNSGDKIATLRVDVGNSIRDVPIFSTGTAVDTVSEAMRIQVNGVTGYVPIVPVSDAAFPELRMQHNSEIHGYHDRVAPGSAIPDKDILQARYDATALSLSDGQTVDPFPDEKGSFNLAGIGNPTYQTGVINGNPVVREDGVDDRNAATLGSALSQPFAYFFTCNIRSVAGGTNEFYLDEEGNPGGCRVVNNQGEWQMKDSSSGANGGTVTSGTHIIGAIFDGSNSVLRVDGADEITTTTSDSTGGLSLGAKGDNSHHAPIDFGEFLIYNDRPTISSVESYLSDKWGITI